MKIVFFTMTMGKGGAERVISILSSRLAQQGQETAVVTCLSGESAYPLDGRTALHSLIPFGEYMEKGKLKTFLPLSRQYVKTMQGIRPDVIISFLPEPCIIAALNRRKLGIPVIGSERSNPFLKYRSRLLRMVINHLYSNMDGFVFQTETARDFFGRRLREKSAVIGNPVSQTDIRRLPERERKKEIIAVGRVTPEKNYPLLIQAFHKASAQYPEYRLRIVGRENDSIDLRGLCAGLNIQDKVIFQGEADNPLDYVKQASVYVLSSSSEGMPNALMEAMSIGMPVIAADCPSGGPRALIDNGKNGLLVPSGSVEDLSDAMKKLITEPELAEEMGRNAEKIAGQYPPEHICRAWQEYVEKIIGSSSFGAGRGREL
jgi:glycosyltransferase involved in cell wall biosynthesis